MGSDAEQRDASRTVVTATCPACGNPNAAYPGHEGRCPAVDASRTPWCVHDGCFRTARDLTGYCCDTCNVADGDGLPPEHDTDCRR